VKTGTGNWERIEIVDGLEEGETIVTSIALQGLDDGVRVNVVEELE
jgi:hypothetical protein